MKKRILFFLLFGYTIVFGQIGISIDGGGFFPVGEFSKTYKQLGYGGEFTFDFINTSSMSLGILAGYQYYEADEEALKNMLLDELNSSLKNNADSYIDLSLEAPLKIYPLVLSAKYFIKGRKWKPFFFFEAGLFFYDLRLNGTLRIGNDIYPLEEQIEKRNSTMLALGFGTKYKITRKFYLTGKFKWSIFNNVSKLEADKDEKIKSINKTVQTLGLVVGVNYLF